MPRPAVRLPDSLSFGTRTTHVRVLVRRPHDPESVTTAPSMVAILRVVRKGESCDGRPTRAHSSCAAPPAPRPFRGARGRRVFIVASPSSRPKSRRSDACSCSAPAPALQLGTCASATAAPEAARALSPASVMRPSFRPRHLRSTVQNLPGLDRLGPTTWTCWP